jgi:ArsR family transcriptional regulator
MQELSKVFKALSDSNRLEIFILLSRRTLCVNALVNCFGISQPAVSQHLRVLRQAGLVSAEKRGYWMHYSANKEKAEQFIRKFNELLGGEKYVQKDKQKRVRTPGKTKGETRRLFSTTSEGMSR